MRIVGGILLAGAVAGVLDIIYAIVVYGPLSYGVPAERVLQSVAAGWIGRDAAQAGGWTTAGLGLASHFMLATIMAAVFFFGALRLRWLTSKALLWGVLYGLILYVVMNYIVVPLSAAGANEHFALSFSEASERLRQSFSEIRPRNDPNYPWLLAGTLFTHTVLVGVPIALIAKRSVATS
ncbi:MAG: hypothetical protein R3C30_14240 [Hyphomonadaceae bacterium]